MTVKSWETKADVVREILARSIKQEWLLTADKLPAKDRLDVTAIPRECGLLSKAELLITETDATGLVERMTAGEWSAEEVLIAFAKRATIGHQLLNFATEFMIDEARDEARKLDAHFKHTGRVIGPLHGVPISVKEMVHFKDRICHTAYASWIDRVPKGDALMIQLLKKAGAVFHVRTNEPQTVMHLDCNNNIYGRTLNPHNLNLTPGGSSGGEGASLGFRCAAIGIGSDIGGSIRAPAAFCGAHGLRPTTLRNPWKGVSLAGEGQESIRCTLGPLTNSIRDLELFQRAILDQEPWEEETSLVPIPWRNVSPKKDFVVGVMWNDGAAQLHPPLRRAFEYGVRKLKAAGINVVDWEPLEHARGGIITQALLFPDGGACIREALEASGEPIHPLSEFALHYAKSMDVKENWGLNVERDTFRDTYQALMKERGVDFILCPNYIGAAAEHGTAHYWLYTSIWNLLDQPGVTFPSGLTVEMTDAVDDTFHPLNEVDATEQKKYAPEKFIGAPLAYQLVGKHFHDEETVAAAKIIEEIIRS